MLVGKLYQMVNPIYYSTSRFFLREIWYFSTLLVRPLFACIGRGAHGCHLRDSRSIKDDILEIYIILFVLSRSLRTWFAALNL